MWIQIYCTVLYCLPYCLVHASATVHTFSWHPLSFVAESSASGHQSGKAPYHSLTLPHLFIFTYHCHRCYWDFWNWMIGTKFWRRKLITWRLSFTKQKVAYLVTRSLYVQIRICIKSAGLDQPISISLPRYFLCEDNVRYRTKAADPDPHWCAFLF